MAFFFSGPENIPSAIVGQTWLLPSSFYRWHQASSLARCVFLLYSRWCSVHRSMGSVSRVAPYHPSTCPSLTVYPRGTGNNHSGTTSSIYLAASLHLFLFWNFNCVSPAFFQSHLQSEVITPPEAFFLEWDNGA